MITLYGSFTLNELATPEKQLRLMVEKLKLAIIIRLSEVEYIAVLERAS